MYPYHNKIKQRINNNELIHHEFITNHKRIKGNVLMLYFKSEPFERPIREHRFDEYKELFSYEKSN